MLLINDKTKATVSYLEDDTVTLIIRSRDDNNKMSRWSIIGYDEEIISVVDITNTSLTILMKEGMSASTYSFSIKNTNGDIASLTISKDSSKYLIKGGNILNNFFASSTTVTGLTAVINVSSKIKGREGKWKCFSQNTPVVYSIENQQDQNRCIVTTKSNILADTIGSVTFMQYQTYKTFNLRFSYTIKDGQVEMSVLE